MANPFTITHRVINIRTIGEEKTASHNVMAKLTYDADRAIKAGAVFANADAPKTQSGYVTRDGVESPKWYGPMARTERTLTPQEWAAQCLASRGSRGALTGKGRTSPRWDVVRVVIDTKGADGFTANDVAAAFEKAGLPKTIDMKEVSRVIRAVRRRDEIALTYDRKEGTYTVAA